MSGFLARRFGKRVLDPVLRNVAVHARYRGVPRPAGRRAGDIRIVTRPDLGWFWFIPLSEEVTSVGLVISKEVHDRRQKVEPEAALDRYVSETEVARSLLAGATRTSPVRVDSDFSYLASEHAGDRWLLAGDAGAFLDPIFSTGVLMAMESGVEAAAAVHRGLTAGDLSRAAFRDYGRRVRRRYDHFRRFALGFYEPAFRDLFFTEGRRWGLRGALLSVLAGDWRPSLAIRIRLAVFLALVYLQRRLPVAPRLQPRGLAGR